MLHFYLQQPGIIKMFLLCNIPGKVLLFFLNKQDIMRVNCMQNVTKNYILLRNVAYVLKAVFPHFIVISPGSLFTRREIVMKAFINLIVKAFISLIGNPRY